MENDGGNNKNAYEYGSSVTQKGHSLEKSPPSSYIVGVPCSPNVHVFRSSALFCSSSCSGVLCPGDHLVSGPNCEGVEHQQHLRAGVSH